MRKLIVVFGLALAIASPAYAQRSKPVKVQEHTKKDGTVVAKHHRAKPKSSPKKVDPEDVAKQGNSKKR